MYKSIVYAALAHLTTRNTTTRKTKTTILLIDDDDDEFEIFTIALNELHIGYDCYHARTAEEAMQLLKGANPEFIFLDMHIPRINSLQCLEQIKQLPQVQAIPFFIYSTHLNTDVCDRALQLGATKCIRKPFRISEMSAMLKKIIVEKYVAEDPMFY